MHACVCVCMYVYIYTHIYIYIGRERETEREREKKKNKDTNIPKRIHLSFRHRHQVSRSCCKHPGFGTTNPAKKRFQGVGVSMRIFMRTFFKFRKVVQGYYIGVYRGFLLRALLDASSCWALRGSLS